MCLNVHSGKFAIPELGGGSLVQILAAFLQNGLQYIAEEGLWLNLNVNIVHPREADIRTTTGLSF